MSQYGILSIPPKIKVDHNIQVESVTFDLGTWGKINIKLQFNFVVLNAIVKTLDFNFISESSTFKFTSTFMFTDQHCTRSSAFCER